MKFRVDILEFESGWGNRVDEIKYFDTELDAKIYVAKYNKDNTKTVVPDWYMLAVYKGQV